MLTEMATLQFLLVLLLSASVLTDDPTVRITTTDPPFNSVEGVIIQERGKDVQLTCVVENLLSGSNVQWTVQNMRKNTSAVQIATATRSYDAFKWAIDSPSTTAWRLRIQNAQITSEGVYTCKVEVASQIPVQDQKELRIVQKPEIADLETSTDMLFNEGDEALLECYATGHPPPVIRWVRLAGELLPTGGTALQSNQLKILKIKHDHAGVYKCIATNTAGSVERRILISVNFGPIASVPNGFELVKQKVGYVKQLVCDIMGYPLPSSSTIKWQRENKPVVIDDRIQLRNIPGAYNRITSILDIRGVTEDDYGRYTCTSDEDAQPGIVVLDRSDTPTKDRSNRIIGGSSHTHVNLALTIVMLLSVYVLHRIHIQ